MIKRETAVVKAPETQKPVSIYEGLATRQQIDIIKSQYAPGISDGELAVCLMECKHRSLDLFGGGAFLVKRWDAQQGKMVWKVQSSVDSMRQEVMRDQSLDGVYGPFWCGKDGEWKDLWTGSEPPFAAKFGVLPRGWKEPRYAIAYWDAYAQRTKEGKLMAWWGKGIGGGAHMLAKCAEALAYRAVNPKKFAGIYIPEELGQEPKEERKVIELPKQTETFSSPPVAAEDIVEPLPPEEVPVIQAEPKYAMRAEPREVIEANDKPSKEELDACRKAWVEAGVKPETTKEIIGLLAGGKKSEDWTREDFKNITEFLGDKYKAPK